MISKSSRFGLLLASLALLSTMVAKVDAEYSCCVNPETFVCDEQKTVTQCEAVGLGTVHSLGHGNVCDIGSLDTTIPEVLELQHDFAVGCGGDGYYDIILD